MLDAKNTDLLTFAKHWGNYGMRQVSARKITGMPLKDEDLSLLFPSFRPSLFVYLTLTLSRLQPSWTDQFLSAHH